MNLSTAGWRAYFGKIGDGGPHLGKCARNSPIPNEIPQFPKIPQEIPQFQMQTDSLNLGNYV